MELASPRTDPKYCEILKKIDKNNIRMEIVPQGYWTRLGSQLFVLGLEKFQTMLLVQVPTPELLVVLCIRISPVNGTRSVFASKSFWRADQRIIKRAKERSHREPRLISIHYGPVPHALVNPIAQCLQLLESLQISTICFLFFQLVLQLAVLLSIVSYHISGLAQFLAGPTSYCSAEFFILCCFPFDSVKVSYLYAI